MGYLNIYYIYLTLIVVITYYIFTCRNIFHTLFFTLLLYVLIAPIFVILKTQFLALTLILLYIGAILVLFTFVILNIGVNVEEKDHRYPFNYNDPIKFIFDVLLSVFLFYSFIKLNPYLIYTTTTYHSLVSQCFQDVFVYYDNSQYDFIGKKETIGSAIKTNLDIMVIGISLYIHYFLCTLGFAMLLIFILPITWYLLRAK